MSNAGWKNYPTWAVYTHLTSDFKTYQAAKKLAQEGEHEFKLFVEEVVGLKLSPLARDLVDYALGEVDWKAIIKALLEE